MWSNELRLDACTSSYRGTENGICKVVNRLDGNGDYHDYNIRLHQITGRHTGDDHFGYFFPISGF